MTIYKGYRHSAGVGAQLVMKDDDILDPGPSQEVWNRSPDGFNWGYAGSGPAQLALGLLYDVVRDRDTAVSFHQAFKRAFVATWGEEWEISSDTIKAWLEEQETTQEAAPVWQQPAEQILRSAERLVEAASVPQSATDRDWRGFLLRETAILLRRVMALRGRIFRSGGTSDEEHP